MTVGSRIGQEGGFDVSPGKLLTLKGALCAEVKRLRVSYNQNDETLSRNSLRYLSKANLSIAVNCSCRAPLSQTASYPIPKGSPARRLPMGKISEIPLVDSTARLEPRVVSSSRAMYIIISHRYRLDRDRRYEWGDGGHIYHPLTKI